MSEVTFTAIPVVPTDSIPESTLTRFLSLMGLVSQGSELD